LSLEEALVNALRHGHGLDPTKVVRVRYHVAADVVLAEVEDEGPGFDPRAVPDPLKDENLERPSGRGILLMRRYMTSVEHKGRGNHLTLCLRRSGVARVNGTHSPLSRV
jgi:serine/threonine-protein kinase RsbW